MNKSNPHGIKPGQRLWYVPRRRHWEEHEVEVKSVGTKWAKIDLNRKKVDLTSLVVFEGDLVAGDCHLSREARHGEMMRWAAWQDFRDSLPCHVPDDISLSDIAAAARALKRPLVGMPTEGDA